MARAADALTALAGADASPEERGCPRSVPVEIVCRSQGDPPYFACHRGAAGVQAIAPTMCHVRSVNSMEPQSDFVVVADGDLGSGAGIVYASGAASMTQMIKAGFRINLVAAPLIALVSSLISGVAFPG